MSIKSETKKAKKVASETKNDPRANGSKGAVMDKLMQDAEYISGLDEMLGLVEYDEMYEALNLPVVALLKSADSEDDDTLWAVVSGMRRENNYRVRGIFYGPCGADGFTGTLSLDGRKLIVDGSTTDVVFARSTSHGRPTRGLLLNTLNGEFRGIYAPFGAGDSEVRSATAAAKRIELGEPVYKALVEECSGGHPPFISNTFKGWYRARCKRAIMDRHREAFGQSGETLALRYIPIAQEVSALNREIGSLRSRINREFRTHGL